jgi:redox-sensitive bicupin YhaK (pirin superfamily)
MTAGRGVVHAEEGARRQGRELHGVQLWVAQPAATRDGPPAFEHHAELPRVELDGGGTATVLVGALGGSASPARRDSDHMGAELALAAPAVTVPLRIDHEHAIVVLAGGVAVHGQPVVPGQLAYLGLGRDELRLDDTVGGSRVLLIGGVPFDEKVVMWWNFVARSPAEITEARQQWMGGDPRFGPVASRLARIPVGPPPWDAA